MQLNSASVPMRFSRACGTLQQDIARLAAPHQQAPLHTSSFIDHVANDMNASACEPSRSMSITCPAQDFRALDFDPCANVTAAVVSAPSGECIGSSHLSGMVCERVLLLVILPIIPKPGWRA